MKSFLLWEKLCGRGQSTYKHLPVYKEVNEEASVYFPCSLTSKMNTVFKILKPFVKILLLLFDTRTWAELLRASYAQHFEIAQA